MDELKQILMWAIAIGAGMVFGAWLIWLAFGTVV